MKPKSKKCRWRDHVVNSLAGFVHTVIKTDCNTLVGKDIFLYKIEYCPYCGKPIEVIE